MSDEFYNRRRKSSVWRTEDELDYIDRLGTHSLSKISRDRKKLLAGYVKAMKERKEWGMVDKIRVMKHAERKWAEM